MVLECNRKECPEMPGDLTIYNLQDALYFNGTTLSFLVNCPAGYACAPGTFPKLFSYPPGTFSIPKPPTSNGFPIVISMQGCSSLVSRTLPAGASQADQDLAALQVLNSVAQQQSECDAVASMPSGAKLPAPITLSDINLQCCLKVPIGVTIVAASNPPDAPYTMSVYPKPSWMVTVPSSNSLFLNGIPTPSGLIPFRVFASGTNSYGEKDYILDVFGISNATALTGGNVGYDYSVQLNYDGVLVGAGINVFTVTAGSLPAGLSLSSSGLISGIPTTVDSAAFTVKVEREDGKSCSKDFTLDVITTLCGQKFTPLVFTVTAAKGGTGQGGNGFVQANCTGYTGANTSIELSGSSPPVYGLMFAANTTCNIRVIFTGTGWASSANIRINRADSTNAINQSYSRNNGNPTPDVDTTFPCNFTGGTFYTVKLTASVIDDAGTPAHYSTILAQIFLGP